MEIKGFCCSDGGIILKENVVSDELYELFTSTCDEACEFKTNVRIYNGNFAFPSVGVKYDKDLRRLNKRCLHFQNSRTNSSLYESAHSNVVLLRSYIYI